MPETTACQICAAKTQLYLCNTHTGELHDMLTGLPPWIEYLQDAAWGQTRLGESARRSTEHGSPMLFHQRASELLAYANSVLVEWCRDIHKIRKLELPTLNKPAEIAEFLADNTSVIAADQHASVCYREIRELITDIEHAINRPIPNIECGPCPTTTERVACDEPLTAKRHDIEVTCRKCHTTHRVEELINKLLANIDNFRVTRDEALETMRRIGSPVPERTFRDWRSKGKLRPCGYLRPNGRRAITRHSPLDEPEYRFADIRRLQAEKPQSTPTGAAARCAS